MNSNQAENDFVVIDPVNFDDSTYRTSDFASTMHSYQGSMAYPTMSRYQSMASSTAQQSVNVQSTMQTSAMLSMQQASVAASVAPTPQGEMSVPTDIQPTKKWGCCAVISFIFLGLVACGLLYEGAFFLVMYLRISSDNSELIVRSCEELRHLSLLPVESIDKLVFTSGCCSMLGLMKELDLEGYSGCSVIQFASNSFPSITKVKASGLSNLKSFVIGSGTFSRGVE